MIKINLLPKTINQKAILRNTALLFAFIFAVLVAGGMAYGFKLRGDVQQMEQLATETEALQKKVEGLRAQAKAKRDSIDPIKKKLKFIDEVLKHNQKYPALYEQIARWTYEKVSYASLQCDGKQVTMQARVKSLDDLGRYLLNMYQASDLFTEVKISGIPGYGAARLGDFSANSTGAFNTGDQGGEIGGSNASLAGIGAIASSVGRTPASMLGGGWLYFTVTCQLKTPIVAPKFEGGGAAADPNAPGGAPPGATPMAPGLEPMGPSGAPGPGQM